MVFGLLLAISCSVSAARLSFSGIFPRGAPFSGHIVWRGGLDEVFFTLGRACFADDASGLPASSPGCGDLVTLPLLPSYVYSYDGSQAPPGSTFQQYGTNYDGSRGKITLLAYSPFALFPGRLFFDGSGGGSLSLSLGVLGTRTGTFTVSPVPLPGAAWLFGSALLGLMLYRQRGRAPASPGNARVRAAAARRWVEPGFQPSR